MPANVPADAAATDITLINLFEVPKGREEDAIRFWERARDFLSQQPGYISTALHRAVSPDAPYTLINVAKWRTAEEFTAATTAMATVLGRPSIEGLAYHPGLYQVIRT